MFLHLALILYSIGVTNPVEASKAERQLYRDLLNGYSKLVRPVHRNRDALRVEMKVFLQQIMNLDGKNQIIEINAWLKFIWRDYRLAWNATKYDNITSVRFAGGENQIWRPDVLLYNSANEDFDSSFKSNEVVYSSGEVNWVPPGIFRASCKMDITYFPFDDQVCHLKFGSWTYNGNALDLHIIAHEGEEPSMDLSTYTPNGEWHLMSAPAVREVSYTACCPEPYCTTTFYMNLRRRTVFYLFNVIMPSLLVSVMTLMGFCLPAHDMSEKIGYQTTILLSICFFVTIVSEVTPPTSESVPLLGMFFSTLTFITAVSLTFTITVLNFRYRQVHNTNMSNLFYKVFLVWIPWLLFMKRPGITYKKRRANPLERDDESFDENCESECCPAPEGFYFHSMDSAETVPIEQGPKPLLKKMHSIPAEHLNLERKVGDGIFRRTTNVKFRRTQSVKSRRVHQFEKYVRRCIEEASVRRTSAHCEYTLSVVQYYNLINAKLAFIKEKMSKKHSVIIKQEEWKFAAMALDRLCLVMFTIFISTCLLAISLSTPHFEP